jgi:hypothetical protein
MSMFRGTLGTMTDESTFDTTLQPPGLDRNLQRDDTPRSDAPQESHPVAPDGPIPSLEEVEAEQA